MADGGLRKLFQVHIPEAMWVPVETWSTGQGVPDVHYLLDGVAGWIEFKATTGWAIQYQPQQIAWLERYSRNMGRAFVAVRRQTSVGPRRGAAADQLWLFRGANVRDLFLNGLQNAQDCALARWDGGPGHWEWPVLKALLIGARSFPGQGSKISYLPQK